MPELPRNFRTAAPRASANVCVQISEPPESHEPTIRIRASRCCRSHATARFSMFLPATVSSRLFGANWIGCLRNGGSEIASEAAWDTAPEDLERLNPEACCWLKRDPEGTTLGLLFAGSPACKTGGAREQAVRPCVDTRSPANKTEVPNITIFEYTLTKKQGLASAGRRDGQLRQQVFYVDEVVVKNLLGDIQQLEDFWVANRIQNVLSVFPASNNTASPQDG